MVFESSWDAELSNPGFGLKNTKSILPIDKVGNIVKYIPIIKVGNNTLKTDFLNQEAFMEKTSEEVFPKEYQVILENLLKDLKYGSINIIVQDGKIIQIDKTEKVRIKN
ncbi:MAG: YezD family protein [Treponemataceae bacterium]|nr:YezD family protein [Treponemataceae bacterium]